MTTTQTCELLINSHRAVNSAGIPYAFGFNKCAMLQIYQRDFQGRIPAGASMLLGNSPEGSDDSTRYGLIPLSDILGPAELVAH